MQVGGLRATQARQRQESAVPGRPGKLQPRLHQRDRGRDFFDREELMIVAGRDFAVFAGFSFVVPAYAAHDIDVDVDQRRDRERESKLRGHAFRLDDVVHRERYGPERDDADKGCDFVNPHLGSRWTCGGFKLGLRALFGRLWVHGKPRRDVNPHVLDVAFWFAGRTRVDFEACDPQRRVAGCLCIELGFGRRVIAFRRICPAGTGFKCLDAEFSLRHRHREGRHRAPKCHREPDARSQPHVVSPSKFGTRMRRSTRRYALTLTYVCICTPIPTHKRSNRPRQRPSRRRFVGRLMAPHELPPRTI